MNTTVTLTKENLAYVIKFNNVPTFYRNDPSALAKLVQMFTGGSALPVLRFVENKDECALAPVATEAKNDDVEMTAEENEELKAVVTVKCFCMLDSFHAVDKAVSGMDGLSVRD